MVATAGSGWRLAPSLVAMVNEADRLWPGRDRTSDGSIGDQDHQNRVSDHNPKDGYVDALDLDYDAPAGADWFVHAENLRLCRDPRIKYVIFFGRVFRSYGTFAWQWTAYTGANAHKAHMHVSVLPEGRQDTSPWFTASTQPPEEEDMPKAHYVLGSDGAVYLASLVSPPRHVSNFAATELVAGLEGVTIVEPPAAGGKDIRDGQGTNRKVWAVDKVGRELFGVP